MPLRIFFVANGALDVIPDYTFNVDDEKSITVENFLLDRRRFVAYYDNVVKNTNKAKKQATALLETQNSRLAQFHDIATKFLEDNSKLPPAYFIEAENYEDKFNRLDQKLTLDENLPEIFKSDEREANFLQMKGTECNFSGKLEFPGFQSADKAVMAVTPSMPNNLVFCVFKFLHLILQTKHRMYTDLLPEIWSRQK
jgi:hypothetical protein